MEIVSVIRTLRRNLFPAALTQDWLLFAVVGCMMQESNTLRIHCHKGNEVIWCEKNSKRKALIALKALKTAYISKPLTKNRRLAIVYMNIIYSATVYPSSKTDECIQLIWLMWNTRNFHSNENKWFFSVPLFKLQHFLFFSVMVVFVFSIAIIILHIFSSFYGFYSENLKWKKVMAKHRYAKNARQTPPHRMLLHTEEEHVRIWVLCFFVDVLRF